MMGERLSPLAHRKALEAAGGLASLAEYPHVGKLILRAEPTVASKAVMAACGATLPTEPSSSTSTEEVRIFWLGPDEWMFVTRDGGETDLADALGKALSETHHQVVDVTDQITAIALGGDKAREMLMKLTTLDLHPSQFAPGAVTGSLFGRATATLHCREDTSGFVLFVRRSFADYLWCALAEAGREFGLVEQVPKGGETMRV